MYRVLIVEDELIQLQALQTILNNYHENFEITVAEDYNSACRAIDSDTIYDFFLLDIKLQNSDSEKTDGIAVGRFIRSMHSYQYTPIIFITSLPERVHEALSDTHCYHYLLKPYTDKDVLMILDHVLHSPLVKEAAFTFTDFWGGQVSLSEESILYFTPSTQRRIKIVTESGMFETIDYKLNQLEEILHHGFIRSHRKYLVNIRHIAAYSNTRRIINIAGQELPVGRNYKSNTERALKGII